MSYPGGRIAPESLVSGHVIGLGTTPVEVLPFPGEGVQYMLDSLYFSAAAVGGTTRRLAFLLERDRGNGALRSEEFNNATWTKTGSSATANTTNAPVGGALTADTVTENAATSEHSVSQAGLSIVSGTIYTIDVYARENGRSIAIQAGTGFTVAAQQPIGKFNIRSHSKDRRVVVSTEHGAEASYEPVGGFFRCRIIVQATSTTGAGSFKIYLQDDDGNINYTGDNTSGVFLWGASIRLRDWSNDYVATAGAAILTQAAEKRAIFARGSDMSGAIFEPNTPIAAERGASIRAVATATITDAVVGASGYKIARAKE